jgi:hypothetical protein
VVIAPHTDEAAVLTTLTAREHNPTAQIVAAVRETENQHLIHQSGADAAIVTAGTAGKLLGFATESPRIVEVLEDLLSVGTGLDITEEIVGPDDDGRPLTDFHRTAPVLAIERGDDVLRFDDAAARPCGPGTGSCACAATAARTGRRCEPRAHRRAARHPRSGTALRRRGRRAARRAVGPRPHVPARRSSRSSASSASWASASPTATPGAGADYLSYVLVLEELSRADAGVGVTLAVHTGAGTMPVPQPRRRRPARPASSRRSPRGTSSRRSR